MKNYWTNHAEQMLVGKVIKSVRFMNKKEMETCGWYKSAIVITLDDGVEIYPSQDEEGNNAGVLFLTHKNQFGLIPALSENEI
jgi:hypothetical protein